LTNEELKNILQSSKSLKEVIRKIGYSPRSGENAYCKIIESIVACSIPTNTVSSISC
jgi:hypothetical protein